MSSKTKIIVLRKKEVLYAAVFTLAGILLLALFLFLFLPDREDQPLTDTGNLTSAESPAPQISPSPKAVVSSQLEVPGQSGILQDTPMNADYVPGIYKTELILGGQSIEIEAVLEKDRISSIRLVDPAETVTTMYPLLTPTMESICKQVYETQSLDRLEMDSSAKYTSLVLLEAIKCCIEKGKR